MYKVADIIKFSEVNSRGNLSFHGLCDYMQDCAMLQLRECEDRLKIGDLHNKAWILTSWEIVVKRMPKIFEEIIVEADSPHFESLFQNRGFRTLDDKGEITTFANSRWVYYNKELNKVEMIPKKILEIYSEKTHKRADYIWSKGNIVIKGEKKEGKKIEMLSSFIDMYGHVNNAKYIMLAEGLLPIDYNVKKIRVEYRNQAFVEDVLYPWIYEMDSKITVVFTGKNEKIYVVVQFLQEW